MKALLNLVQSQDIGEMEVNIDINDLHEFEIVPDLELN